MILAKRLAAAVDKLNPTIPAEARGDALRKILATERPSLIEENRRLHKLFVEGVDVEFYTEDGTIRGDKVRLIDFDNPESNDWLATGQFTVIEGSANRRPDIVVFVNGLPLGVIELKAPGSENATLTGAFNQLQTYKAQIPSLFRSNAVLVTSDAITARVGSLTANEDRFMPWRTTDGEAIAAKGEPELGVLIEGVFDKRRFLDLIRDFTVFGESDAGLIKIIAGYHQFHAVGRAVASTLRALAIDRGAVTGWSENPENYRLPGVSNYPRGDKRIGVIWHTQGSGKSFLMAFYAGQLVRHPGMENPTIVVLTDRNDLDDQLFNTFSMCRDLIRQTPIHVESREDLRSELARASGGVIFTTIQKFSPAAGETDLPVLTNRRNVIVIADEAHRSQYGFGAKVERKTGKIAYGFAKYLRDALPNASFIGFTGTPIEKDDTNMGNDALKVIAHELLMSLKSSVTVDWSHRESARARMRVLVKRILRKHGYPPRPSRRCCPDRTPTGGGAIRELVSIAGAILSSAAGWSSNLAEVENIGTPNLLCSTQTRSSGRTMVKDHWVSGRFVLRFTQASSVRFRRRHEMRRHNRATRSARACDAIRFVV